ncbi:uncharacterized protein UDID_20113 [Ustilago sp. UG-2017a]|nr:uncharacterized protein UDID_20113 [Ustilago sp. UG-2017a]
MPQHSSSPSPRLGPHREEPYPESLDISSSANQDIATPAAHAQADRHQEGDHDDDIFGSIGPPSTTIPATSHANRDQLPAWANRRHELRPVTPDRLPSSLAKLKNKVLPPPIAPATPPNKTLFPPSALGAAPLRRASYPIFGSATQTPVKKRSKSSVHIDTRGSPAILPKRQVVARRKTVPLKWFPSATPSLATKPSLFAWLWSYNPIACLCGTSSYLLSVCRVTGSMLYNLASRYGRLRCAFALIVVLLICKALLTILLTPIFSLVADDLLTVCNFVKARASSVRHKSWRFRWYLSEHTMVPFLRASKKSRYVSRWMAVLNEQSHADSTSNASSSANLVNSFTDLATAVAAAATVTATTTATATITATATTVAMTTALSKPAATDIVLTPDVVPQAAASTSAHIGEAKVVLVWAEPDKVQSCMQLITSLLHDSLASPPATSWSTSSNSEPVSSLEQLYQLHPSVKAAADKHPECFQAPMDMFATGSDPSHPYDSYLARNTYLVLEKRQSGRATVDQDSSGSNI